MLLGCCGIAHPGFALCLYRKCSKLWTFWDFWVSFMIEIHFRGVFRSTQNVNLPDLFCSQASPGVEEWIPRCVWTLTLRFAPNLRKSRPNGFQMWSFQGNFKDSLYLCDKSIDVSVIFPVFCRRMTRNVCFTVDKTEKINVYPQMTSSSCRGVKSVWSLLRVWDGDFAFAV